MRDVRGTGVPRGCVALIVWVAVTRGVYIPVALLLPADLPDGQGVLLGFGISMVISALLVTVPLRMYFSRANKRRRLADAALAYRRRQDDRSS